MAEGNIAADQLRLFIERIERLEEEKKGIADDIRDVYSEAKSQGYDAKIMRQIVRLRKMSQDDRQESYAAEEEDAIQRMMEMAGIAEGKGKKPDFLDVDKDGDKKEPFKKAVDDKKEEKVDESIFAMTAKLWKSYKG